MFGSIFLLFWNCLLDWSKFKVYARQSNTIHVFDISFFFNSLQLMVKQMHFSSTVWVNYVCLSFALFKACCKSMIFFLIVLINYCVKSVRIRSFPVHIFPHSVWIRRDIKYVSVFSTNAEKCRPEKPQIRTLFSQWIVLTLQVGRGY